jgi:hypothetical protein
MVTTRLLSRSLALVLELGTILIIAIPANAAVWVPGHCNYDGLLVPGHWRPGGPRVFVAAPGAVVAPPWRSCHPIASGCRDTGARSAYGTRATGRSFRNLL